MASHDSLELRSMSDSSPPRRREPPQLRPVTVAAIRYMSPYMARVTVAGPELSGFELREPAASIRLLVPSSGTSHLVIPEWNGNEFLLPGGERPVIRTFTPRRFDPDTLQLDIDIVIHAGGATSAWVAEARPGNPAAVTNPGRGYRIDHDAPAYFLAGDETAIPAIGQLLEQLPETASVQVVIEIAHPEGQFELPNHPQAEVEWTVKETGSSPGTALINAIRAAAIERRSRIWVAGEAGSLVAVRKNLFEERGLERSRVTVRGYWKHGR